MSKKKRKRTDSIVAVTVAKYATMYIEADTPDEAMEYAKKHCDNLSDSDFWESDIHVSSWDNYTTEADESMDEIWIEDGEKITYDEYMDELEEQEEE